MIRSYCVAVLVTLLVGCQPKENKEQLKAINVSLKKSSELVKDVGRRILLEMEGKKFELPGDEDIARTMAIMNRINIQADSLAVEIENLQDEILMQSDGLEKEDAVILETLQQPNGLGIYLLKKLASFKDRIPASFIINDSVCYPFNDKALKEEIKSLWKSSHYYLVTWKI